MLTSRLLASTPLFVLSAALPPSQGGTDATKTSNWLPTWSSTVAPLRVDWPTFGNGPSHTGYFPDVVASAPLVPEWTATLGGDIQQVAVGNGRVFATPLQYFGQAWLASLDATTGATDWNYPFSTCYSINPPTYDRGHVFVQRGDHASDTQLWNFSASTGVPHWVSPHGAQWERYMAPAVAEGKVWVDGGGYGGMYGFQETDGAQLFFDGALPQYDGWTPTYAAGSLYSWTEGVFRQHDKVTGAHLWSLDFGWDWSGWTMGRTIAIADGRAYVVGNPGLHAIDLSARTAAWNVAGDFNGTPSVANGVVYAIAGGFVKAYDAWDGHYLGVYVGEAGLLDQPVVTDDAVVFSSLAHTYIYDRATYQLRQTLPYGGHLSLTSGRLYLATSAGEVRTYVVAPATQARPNLIADWQTWDTSVPNRISCRLSISNVGTSASAPCHVKLALSSDTRLEAGDRIVHPWDFPAVAVGETLSTTIDLTWYPSMSGKFLLVSLDSEASVAETNENNLFPSCAIP